ncbi:MAG: HEAT repeat domain-containing protein [Myxococcales bacterium]|nr:HEAT repeat domain-containing protein [Myxococcales bacterium]
MLLRLLETLFPVRPGERRLTLALFLHSLFAVGAFMAGRTVRDALFLANGDKGHLPWMYVASAVGVTLAGLAYAPIAARVRRDRVALVSALGFSGLFAVAFALERSGARWVYYVLYVYVEVMGALALVQFWTLANELFNAREAKRLYGLIGAGGTISNILVGFAAGKIALAFGASALLLLCAFLLLGTAVASFSAGRVGRQRMFAKAAVSRSTARRPVRPARVLASGHLRTVAVLAAVTFFTTTIVDFEFKVIASQSYSKDELAAYFGFFNAVVGALALTLQLFGTGKLLNRAGVIGSLSVLPLSLAMGNLSLALFPVLWAASLAKGADTLFRYSVNDATTQILYLPVTPQARAAAKAFVDGVVKPAAIGLCGLALAGYKAWLGGDPTLLAWACLVLCGGWMAVVAALRSRYLRSLQDNLRNRRLDLASARHKVVDGSTNSVLVRALESGDPREVLNALELLPHLEDLQLDQRVEPLLDHALPEVRMAALEYYARRQTMRFANSIFRKFEDHEPKVRAAAIDAFCAIGRDKSVRSVRPFLSDPDPGVRSSAVTGMIRYGGLDGVLVAAEALKELIAHPEPVMRMHAAKVLGAIGVKNFYQPVLQLMNDSDPSVRRQAIHSAGSLKSPEFVIPLIYKMQSVETMREAIDALSAFGATITPTLAKVLSNRVEEPSIRRSVARVLGRLGTVEAVEVIARHLDEPDEELRTRLYRALARAVKGRRLLMPDKRPVEEALQRELTRAYLTLARSDALALGQGPTASTPRSGEKAALALLASALAEKVLQAERRMFSLLSVLYPEADMEQIYAGIRDAAASDAARRRANAVELLDNLLDRSFKKVFLPLVEEIPRSDKLRQVADVIQVPSVGREQALLELIADETAWVRACALWYAALTDFAPARDRLFASSSDPSAFVREIALIGLAQSVPEQERVRAIAEAKLTDEAPIVRRQAALIATRRAS